MAEVVIGVGGMTCQGCVRSVTSALTVLTGVVAAEVSLERAQVKVSYDPAATNPQALREAVEAAGFDPS